MKQFGIVFALTGLGFLIASTWLFVDHWGFMSQSEPTTGEIVKIRLIESDEGNSYLPVIRFWVGNDSVIASPGSPLSPSYPKDKFKVGNTIHLRYDKQHPTKIFLTGFFDNWGLMTILGGLGILLFPIGLIAFFKPIRRQKQIEWLQLNGEKIEARFESVQVNYGTTKNDKNPYYISCTWTDPVTKKEYIYVSDAEIWDDPTPKIPPTRKIFVWVHPLKREVHWMDIEFLK